MRRLTSEKVGPRPAVIRRAIAFLHAKGVQLPKRDEAPLFHRVAWRFGMAIAPPAYAGWFANFVILGVAFALGWGVIVCAVTLVLDGALPPRLYLAVALMAVCMGIIRAFQFQRLQRRVGLPGWRAFLRQHAGDAREDDRVNSAS
ncbi:hypothetical protein ARC20_02910 [Stenotrophomonas panacihumi]|uniref:Uncharacterized protein n=2 Tax=Stenotrophomonas panacihumi TaxID=676599 RepID=A0A0R0ARR0_9GAMM|nr:hypothetical protein ARC20_02910 [Stenotrophomonas panacihumi]PTN55723.1 hypothetical protein C9J98_03860 [Stenotrophomonas panacihumi]